MLSARSAYRPSCAAPAATAVPAPFFVLAMRTFPAADRSRPPLASRITGTGPGVRDQIRLVGHGSELSRRRGRPHLRNVGTDRAGRKRGNSRHRRSAVASSRCSADTPVTRRWILADRRSCSRPPGWRSQDPGPAVAHRADLSCFPAVVTGQARTSARPASRELRRLSHTNVPASAA